MKKFIFELLTFCVVLFAVYAYSRPLSAENYTDGQWHFNVDDNELVPPLMELKNFDFDFGKSGELFTNFNGANSDDAAGNFTCPRANLPQYNVGTSSRSAGGHENDSGGRGYGTCNANRFDKKIDELQWLKYLANTDRLVKREGARKLKRRKAYNARRQHMVDSEDDELDEMGVSTGGETDESREADSSHENRQHNVNFGRGEAQRTVEPRYEASNKNSIAKETGNHRKMHLASAKEIAKIRLMEDFTNVGNVDKEHVSLAAMQRNREREESEKELNTKLSEDSVADDNDSNNAALKEKSDKIEKVVTKKDKQEEDEHERKAKPRRINKYIQDILDLTGLARKTKKEFADSVKNIEKSEKNKNKNLPIEDAETSPVETAHGETKHLQRLQEKSASQNNQQEQLEHRTVETTGKEAALQRNNFYQQSDTAPPATRGKDFKSEFLKNLHSETDTMENQAEESRHDFMDNMHFESESAKHKNTDARNEDLESLRDESDSQKNRAESPVNEDSENLHDLSGSAKDRAQDLRSDFLENLFGKSETAKNRTENLRTEFLKNLHNKSGAKKHPNEKSNDDQQNTDNKADAKDYLNEDSKKNLLQNTYNKADATEYQSEGFRSDFLQNTHSNTDAQENQKEKVQNKFLENPSKVLNEFLEKTHSKTDGSEFLQNSQSKSDGSEFQQNTQTKTDSSEFLQNSQSKSDGSEFQQNSQSKSDASGFLENSQSKFDAPKHENEVFNIDFLKNFDIKADVPEHPNEDSKTDFLENTHSKANSLDSQDKDMKFLENVYTRTGTSKQQSEDFKGNFLDNTHSTADTPAYQVGDFKSDVLLNPHSKVGSQVYNSEYGSFDNYNTGSKRTDAASRANKEGNYESKFQQNLHDATEEHDFENTKSDTWDSLKNDEPTARDNVEEYLKNGTPEDGRKREDSITEYNPFRNKQEEEIQKFVQDMLTVQRITKKEIKLFDELMRTHENTERSTENNFKRQTKGNKDMHTLKYNKHQTDGNERDDLSHADVEKSEYSNNEINRSLKGVNVSTREFFEPYQSIYHVEDKNSTGPMNNVEYGSSLTSTYNTGYGNLPESVNNDAYVNNFESTNYTGFGNLESMNNVEYNNKPEATNNAALDNKLVSTYNSGYDNKLESINNAGYDNKLESTYNTGFGSAVEATNHEAYGNNLEPTNGAAQGNDLDSTNNAAYGNNLDFTSNTGSATGFGHNNNLDLDNNAFNLGFDNNTDTTNAVDSDNLMYHTILAELTNLTGFMNTTEFANDALEEKNWTKTNKELDDIKKNVEEVQNMLKDMKIGKKTFEAEQQESPKTSAKNMPQNQDVPKNMGKEAQHMQEKPQSNSSLSATPDGHKQTQSNTTKEVKEDHVLPAGQKNQNYLRLAENGDNIRLMEMDEIEKMVNELIGALYKDVEKDKAKNTTMTVLKQDASNAGTSSKENEEVENEEDDAEDEEDADAEEETEDEDEQEDANGEDEKATSAENGHQPTAKTTPTLHNSAHLPNATSNWKSADQSEENFYEDDYYEIYNDKAPQQRGIQSREDFEGINPAKNDTDNDQTRTENASRNQVEAAAKSLTKNTESKEESTKSKEEPNKSKEEPSKSKTEDTLKTAKTEETEGKKVGTFDNSMKKFKSEKEPEISYKDLDMISLPEHKGGDNNTKMLNASNYERTLEKVSKEFAENGKTFKLLNGKQEDTEEQPKHEKNKGKQEDYERQPNKDKNKEKQEEYERQPTYEKSKEKQRGEDYERQPSYEKDEIDDNVRRAEKLMQPKHKSKIMNKLEKAKAEKEQAEEEREAKERERERERKKQLYGWQDRDHYDYMQEVAKNLSNAKLALHGYQEESIRRDKFYEKHKSEIDNITNTEKMAEQIKTADEAALKKEVHKAVSDVIHDLRKEPSKEPELPQESFYEKFLNFFNSHKEPKIEDTQMQQQVDNVVKSVVVELQDIINSEIEGNNKKGHNENRQTAKAVQPCERNSDKTELETHVEQEIKPTAETESEKLTEKVNNGNEAAEAKTTRSNQKSSKKRRRRIIKDDPAYYHVPRRPMDAAYNTAGSVGYYDLRNLTARTDDLEVRNAADGTQEDAEYPEDLHNGYTYLNRADGPDLFWRF